MTFRNVAYLAVAVLLAGALSIIGPANCNVFQMENTRPDRDSAQEEDSEQADDREQDGDHDGESATGSEPAENEPAALGVEGLKSGNTPKQKKQKYSVDVDIQLRGVDARYTATVLKSRTLQRHKSQLRYCYEKHLAGAAPFNPFAPATYRVSISAEGRPTESDMLSSQLKDPDIETCIAKALKRIRFPKPEAPQDLEITVTLIDRKEPRPKP